MNQTGDKEVRKWWGLKNLNKNFNIFKILSLLDLKVMVKRAD